MLLFVTSAECQTTLISDAAFEQVLIDLNIDDQLDGSVLTANIVGVAAMDISNKNIQDLTGIQDFAALYNFDCTSNELISLDVSSNLNLVFFSCSNNNLTSLTMPEASSVFRELDFSNNSLTHFEMTNYTNVAWIAGLNNQLTSVDLSGSTIEFVISFENNELTDINLDGAEIRSLRVSNNNLSALDLSEQLDLHAFSANDNPNLECINVSQVQLDDIPNNWNVDVTTSYAIDCLTVSTSTISDETKWLVYPNPLRNNLFIADNKNIEIERVTVKDMLGKMVLVEKNNFESLNVSGLKSGVLFITIETENEIITKKIIKE
jgi:hypothetical protein